MRCAALSRCSAGWLNADYWGLGSCHLLLDHLDQAVDFLERGRAAAPGLWYMQLWLAGALGLKDDLERAPAALRNR